MPYTVDYSTSSKTAITVNDGTVDTSTSVNLIGKNYTNFGELLNENLLHLLENFANANAPTNPTEGQLWYDSTPGKEQLKVYNLPDWVPVGGIIRGTTEPEAANRDQ